jgi:hypothetical protein
LWSRSEGVTFGAQAAYALRATDEHSPQSVAVLLDIDWRRVGLSLRVAGQSALVRCRVEFAM